jgi:hypothetical protein
MSDNIKIVYSWIGPIGPVWNTEFPNLLSLSVVSGYANLTTTRVDSDDIYLKIFKGGWEKTRKEGFRLGAVMDMSKEDMFVYPFSLSWRIPLERYFQQGEGLLEFSHTPHHIINLVRNGRGFFLTDQSLEAFVDYSQLHRIHSYFQTSGIPLNKVIHLTGCMNSNEVYRGFLRDNNLSTDPKDMINILSYPTHQTNMVRAINDSKWVEPIYNTETVPSKLFLTWNRRFRSHRIDLVLGLEKLNLVERSYISMGVVDPEQAQHNFAQVAGGGSPELGTDGSHVVRFFNRLPLEVDHEKDLLSMCSELKGTTGNFYKDSLISIVTETNYNQNEVTTTEKTFKPMMHKHPLIMVGSPKTLQALKDMGYKTFGQWWSEQYDNIHDPTERMKEIYRIIEEIGTWSNEKILQFKKEVQPTVEHNYEIVKKDIAETIASQIDALVRKHSES